MLVKKSWILVAVTLLSAVSITLFFMSPDKELNNQIIQEPTSAPSPEPAIPIIDSEMTTPETEIAVAGDQEASQFLVPQTADEYQDSRSCTEALTYEMKDVEKERIVDTLMQSKNSSHLAAAAFLTSANDRTKRLALFYEAHRIDPQNPMILLELYELCARDTQPTCKTSDWEKSLGRLGENNSAVWVAIALSRVANDNPAAALEALDKATTAAISHEFFLERVHLIEQGLMAAGNLSYPQRVAVALDAAGRQMEIREIEIFKICKNRIKSDEQWLETCLALSEHSLTRGIASSLMSKLQEDIFEHQGDQDRLDQVRQRAAEMEILMQQIPTNAFSYLISSEQMLTGFFTEFFAGGMASAAELLVHEYNKLDAEERAKICSGA